MMVGELVIIILLLWGLILTPVAIFSINFVEQDLWHRLNKAGRLVFRIISFIAVLPILVLIFVLYIIRMVLYLPYMLFTNKEYRESFKEYMFIVLEE